MLPKTAAMKTNNPDEVRYCCTHCGDDGFHMYFNLRKNVFHCFKCGIRGVSKPKRSYTDEALTEMYEVLMGKKTAASASKVLILPASQPVRPGSFAMRYMIRRGIPTEKVTAMGCLVSNEEEFENRIIIPAYNFEGKVTYYQARALLKSMSPKYLNPLAPKGRAIFCSWGTDVPTNLETLFVVEGVFKALKFWEIGLPAVAIFGKEATRDQVKAINFLADEVVIMLDPDAIGFSLKMRDEMQVIGDFRNIRVIAPHLAPDDMTADELREILHKGGLL